MNDFADAVGTALATLGPGRIAALAEGIAGHRSTQELTELIAVPDFPGPVTAVLDAQQADGLTSAEAAAYLRGAAAGYSQHTSERAHAVWSGPASRVVPVRATAQVLIDLVAHARCELILTTYSAKPYAPVIDALTEAAERGIRLDVVVETLQGAGSALNGVEPAHAFRTVPGARLWHWPSASRTEPNAKMHAKVAVADQHTLLVTSANLTQAGITSNMEAGLVVHGGEAPTRVSEHLRQLMGDGTLCLLTG
ncbi:DISARM system phospholipase D-like protein DrmC [Cryptosporangium sp. NPDC048952]|uniref:DISARM system phospholipase D-like protein DrmC n=1 Tax=Cryptosporangium sp. NPDC048952 TaxID=3363961 RepID=UPI00372429C4